MNTIARIKREGKHFEIIVDSDKALRLKKGEAVSDFLEMDAIFYDSKKGQRASEEDLNKAFGTNDVQEIAKQIVEKGEVLLSQEHRDEEREKKFKQIVDFLCRNSIDPQSGRPHTPERIKSALEQARVNIKNKPLDEQMQEIVDSISSILPIKIQKKRVRAIIPAASTGKVYGLITKYKEKEEWLSNGDLEVILAIPSGIVMEFYDKLNGITHGSVVTEEIKENE